ncbi:uncharacterized protein METZ01_LOCUS81194 [marine metagenome]|uniref:FAD dependent oxidoreductase domain-containing protein n=1 Tax=marine metagenome TaxID=408172 RepID=A0A381UJP3_9ZZZZ
MTTHYDAIIVGGGHNGLTCGAYLERVLGMPGGHELHGEVAVDQLFFQRPTPHYADSRSPIHALYQCGSSAHPGGSVSAVPGHNAAREILKDYKRLK